jgi:hypothetical protein
MTLRADGLKTEVNVFLSEHILLNLIRSQELPHPSIYLMFRRSVDHISVPIDWKNARFKKCGVCCGLDVQINEQICVVYAVFVAVLSLVNEAFRYVRVHFAKYVLLPTTNAVFTKAFGCIF